MTATLSDDPVQTVPAPTDPLAPASSVPAASFSRAGRRARSDELLPLLAATDDDRLRQQLRAELVELNLDVVESVVSRYRNRGVERDDLLQVGSLGLVKAVDGFDPGSGFAFLSYAVPTIRGEVLRYFRDSGWTVRPPRAVQELQPKIGFAREHLTHRLGRPPRPSDIAEHLQVDLEDVIEAMSADGCFRPTSLDTAFLDSDSAPLVDSLVGPDADLTAAEARTVLGPALRHLAPRDRRILYLRFFDGLTQREIGEQFGISQMQVSRILARVLAQLRESIDPAVDKGDEESRPRGAA